jgi:hypothetical protein
MVRELQLKPGWLSTDMEKAAERVREWTSEKANSTREQTSPQNAGCGLSQPTKSEPRL